MTGEMLIRRLPATTSAPAAIVGAVGFLSTVLRGFAAVATHWRTLPVFAFGLLWGVLPRL